jgi:hypothetical protein
VAFGDNPVDQSLRDAWHTFCDQVKTAGDYIFKDESGSSEGERTNSFRYLTQNLSQAFDMWLENHDTRYPNLHAFCGPTRGLGADNADCIYLQSWINDHDTYKISGRMGSAKMFNIAVQGPWLEWLHQPFGDSPAANLFGHQIHADWDGNFVVWLSPEPHEGNWIQSTPGMRKIFYRQYFDTWDEEPASYRIERIGDADEPPPAMTAATLIEAFQNAGTFVVDCVKDWPDTLWKRDGNYDAVNAFVRHGRVDNVNDDGGNETAEAMRGRVIETMNWDIALDEAVILEFEPQPDWFWQITACTVFGASLEFRYRQVSLTSGMSPIDSDGVTRVIVSHTDPGFANWIDTQEHTRGYLYFRNMLTRETPQLRTRLVKAADLESEIGAVATRITPEERVAELRRRRAGNMRRYPI